MKLKLKIRIYHKIAIQIRYPMSVTFVARMLRCCNLLQKFANDLNELSVNFLQLFASRYLILGLQVAISQIDVSPMFTHSPSAMLSMPGHFLTSNDTQLFFIFSSINLYISIDIQSYQLLSTNLFNSSKIDVLQLRPMLTRFHQRLICHLKNFTNQLFIYKWLKPFKLIYSMAIAYI